MIEGKEYYQKKSAKYKRYEFSSKAKLVKGKRPDFFNLIKKYSNKKFVVLDLGCGSGELTLRISPYFKKIIGIDPVNQYIATAKKDKRVEEIKNVEFYVADGKCLPFDSNSFDLIISSRGPLSSDRQFFKESKRVLKNEGLIIEETIGENDKIELKKIFERGQNYPFSKTKIKHIKEILDEENFELLYFEYYTFYQNYYSIDNVLKTLSRAPIIPDFDPIKDNNKVKKMREELFLEEEIILSSHRLHWVAQKTL